jgi:two-component system sensor histidine kinase CpxA
MMPSTTIRTKVTLLAILNAVLLIAALVWFARTQLTQDLGSLLIGESRGRITAVAVQLGRDLPVTPMKERNQLLARYAAAHGVSFYLFHNNGTQVAGPAVSPPEPVMAHLREARAKTPMAERLGSLSRPEQLRAMAPPLNRPELDRLLLVVEEAPFFARTDRGTWLAFRMPLRSPEEPGFQPGLLLMAAPSFFGTPFFFNLKPWIAMSGLVLAIAVVCWLPLVRGVTKSITTLVAETAMIAKGKFNTKVDIRRSDELGQLGNSFNRMAAQLDGYVHGQKRFLRDTAHEIRSPLARMQAAMGNISEIPVSPEAEEYLEALREEIDLMSSLTGELLTFAREEGTRGKIKLAGVNLLETAHRVVSTENPEGSADIRVNIAPEIQVVAHPESLFRAVSNSVRNAIRYAAHAGPVTVSASREGDSVILMVSDQGPGIPDAALELVFTPFYRLDDSRQRANGGNGLGMSIVRTCIETCEGTVYCRNGNPGLQVVVTLQATTDKAV